MEYRRCIDQDGRPLCGAETEGAMLVEQARSSTCPNCLRLFANATPLASQFRAEKCATMHEAIAAGRTSVAPRHLLRLQTEEGTMRQLVYICPTCGNRIDGAVIPALATEVQ